jgi:hypothetical protein
VELGYTLRVGTKPKLFTSLITWDRCFSGCRLKRPTNFEGISKLIPFLDTRLVNIWEDLEYFCRQVHVALHTGQILSHEAYNNLMISVLYRLLQLETLSDPLPEALRLGMLLFGSSIYFQWHIQDRGSDRIAGQLSDALDSIRVEAAEIPDRIAFWLLMIWKVSASGEIAEQRHIKIFHHTVTQLGIKSWEQAQSILKPMIWIQSLQSLKGQMFFADALQSSQENGDKCHCDSCRLVSPSDLLLY